jgi:hypothetical protein
MDKIEQLLVEISGINKKYEDIMATTGESFNVFEILNLEANETRTHSAFLKALLNPKGKHGLGDTMLKHFLEVIDYKELDIATAKVDEKERVIGEISKDYNEGGRIDIIIEDSFGHGIIIENKIYASDQEKQLARYFNHAKIEYPKGFKLLYLNLNGTKPSQSSIENGKGTLFEGVDYFIISYRNEINKWLESCIEKASNYPIIRETIKQYLYLINKLTKQSTSHKMKEEIKQLLSSDFNKFKSAQIIGNAYNDLRKDIVEQVRKKFERKNEVICEWRTYKIKFIQEIDNEGFFFGFKAVDINGNIISNLNQELSQLQEYLKVLNNSFKKNNSNWISWSFFNGFTKLEWLDDNQIFELKDLKKQDIFLQKLYEEAKMYIDKLKEKVKELS